MARARPDQGAKSSIDWPLHTNRLKFEREDHLITVAAAANITVQVRFLKFDNPEGYARRLHNPDPGLATNKTAKYGCCDQTVTSGSELYRSAIALALPLEVNWIILRVNALDYDAWYSDGYNGKNCSQCHDYYSHTHRSSSYRYSHGGECPAHQYHYQYQADNCSVCAAGHYGLNCSLYCMDTDDAFKGHYWTYLFGKRHDNNSSHNLNHNTMVDCDHQRPVVDCDCQYNSHHDNNHNHNANANFNFFCCHEVPESPVISKIHNLLYRNF
nr:hypothetical protein BaRGS_027698 [Batillaria attramentaria]